MADIGETLRIVTAPLKVVERGIRAALPRRWRHAFKGKLRRAKSRLRSVMKPRRQRSLGPTSQPVPSAPPLVASVRLVVLLDDPAARWRLSALTRHAWCHVAEPRDYQEQPGDYVYSPDPQGKALSMHDLWSVYLTLCCDPCDLVVVSRSIESPPAVAVASRRDNVVARAGLRGHLADGAPFPNGSRGRVLRLVADGGPAPGAASLPSLLGIVCRCEGNSFVTGDRRPAAPKPPRVDGSPPLDPADHEDDRPLVLVLPGVFAVGGVERNTLEVLGQLRDRYRFVLATTEPHEPARGALHHDLTGLCEGIYDLGEIAAFEHHLPLLRRLHERYRFDCVWIVNGSVWLSGNLATVRALFADIPIIDQQVYDTEHGWISCYRDPAIRAFDRHIAINSRIAAAFEQRFRIFPDRIHLIYHAIDAAKWEAVADDPARGAAARAAWNVPDDVPIHGFIGRLTPQKQPLDFLDLARRSQADGHPDVFVMAGDGELAEECRSYVREHSLANVRLIGFVRDPAGMFKAISGLVITSAYEGLPIVSLEAMAVGVPVLATDVGDLRVVGERHGTVTFFEPNDDAEHHYRTFRCWCDERDAHRERAGCAAAAIRRAFSADVIAQQYDDVFRQALADADRSLASGRSGARPAAGLTGHASISIVIPTYNRKDRLEAVVTRYAEVATGLDHELIVIDDGSTDGTDRLLDSMSRSNPHIRHRSVRNGGPGIARNVGADMARKEVVLFVGDDILPCDDRFVRTHARLHAEHPGEEFAALGKVVWPMDGSIEVTPVMRQIQGWSGEQFGYAHLRPYSSLDWRFFYTCNVSVKRRIVSDWLQEGFSSDFAMAAFEDVEFAYRMFQRPGGMQIYYDPAALGAHHHMHSVRTFLDRQTNAGRMAVVFVGKYPEVARQLALDTLIDAMRSARRPDRTNAVAEMLSVIEGIKAFAMLLEMQGTLGDSHWHGTFLQAVFELTMLQGFVGGWSSGDADTDVGYELILAGFLRRIEPIMEIELPGARRIVEQIRSRLAAA